MQELARFSTAQTCNALLLLRDEQCLLVGQYQHDAATDTRQGRIECLDCRADVGADCSLRSPFSKEPEFSGIFDLSLVTREDAASRGMVVVCGTEGEVQLWRRHVGETGWSLEPAAWLQQREDGLMTTSADFVSATWLCSTHHKGGCVLTDVAAEKVLRSWEGHTFDAWVCCSMSPTQSEPMLLTGGDDARLRCWDLRQSGSAPAFSIEHNAGVVSINTKYSLPGALSSTNLLLAGTYDDQCYLYDMRAVKKSCDACALKHSGVGGGVWRVRPFGEASATVLIAAMQTGALIGNLNTNDGDGALLEELAWFHTGEDELIYDVCAVDSTRVASLNFYKKEVKVWRCDVNELAAVKETHQLAAVASTAAAEHGAPLPDEAQ